jgi:hypothetical protein
MIRKRSAGDSGNLLPKAPEVEFGDMRPPDIECFIGRRERHHEYQGHWLRTEVLILFEIPPQDFDQLFAGKLNFPWLAIQGRLMSPTAMQTLQSNCPKAVHRR